MKQLLNKAKPVSQNQRAKPKLERSSKRRMYKIRAAAGIPALSELIDQDPSLDLTWTQFCKHGWLNNNDNPSTEATYRPYA